MKASMSQIQLLVFKNSKFNIRKIHTVMRLFAIRIYQFCVARNKTHQLLFPYIVPVEKKSIDTLMNEMQRFVFEKVRFVFQKKAGHSQLSARWVHEVCHTMTSSRNVIVEK